MLSAPAIIRSLRQSDTDRLIQGLIGAGLPVPKVLHSQLRVRPILLKALAARRIAEIELGPSTEAIRMAEELMSEQRRDGGFGHGQGASERCELLTTIAAAAAMSRLRDLLEQESRESLTLAIQRALRACEQPWDDLMKLLGVCRSGEARAQAVVHGRVDPRESVHHGLSDASWGAVAMMAYLIPEIARDVLESPTLSTGRMLWPEMEINPWPTRLDEAFIAMMDASSQQRPADAKQLWHMARLSLPIRLNQMISIK